MARLAITLACGDYDRTRALADGRVTVEGADLTVLALGPEEIFFRMARFEEFDVAELSLSTFVLTAQRDAPFVAIPVFPSRAFRHSGIYVHSGAGVGSPPDLVGRRVGVAEYQLTANVWIRGILADFHSVPVNSVSYVTGGLHQGGRREKVAIPDLPGGVEITACPGDRTLSEMLVTGEIDALYTPRVPRPFLDGDPRVRRLFPDVREAEESYYRQTRIFPIMHVVVIRRGVYQRSRWLASSLVKAFTQARDLAFRGLDETASLPYVLPWVYEEIGRVRALMGDDYWSYGLNPANRMVLSTFLRYAREQGLAGDGIEADDLFAPETRDELVIWDERPGRARNRARGPGNAMTEPVSHPSERRLVALACRVLAIEGLAETTLGHVSLRVDGTHLLVRARRASEHGLLFTTAEDIALTDLDGNLAPGEPPISLPAELPIHTALLRSRPDCAAVVHAHSPAVVACTVADVPLRPVIGAYNVPAMRLAAGGIPTYRFSGLIRTAERAAGLLQSMGDRPACLLRGHGLAAAGGSLAAAVLTAIDVHVLARLTVTCWQMGRPLTEIDPDDYRDLPVFGEDYYEQVWRSYAAKAERVPP